MYKGIYAAASAMIVQESMHDVTANNLANAATSGFRKRIPVNKSFPDVLIDRIEKYSGDGGKLIQTSPFRPGFRGAYPIGGLSLANVISETFLSTEQGALTVTGNPLDGAILGEGYFTVRDGEGNTLYTRSGHFQRSSEGQLVTHDGMTVLGAGGPVEFGDASSLSLGPAGEVIADGEIVDTLSVVTFEKPTYLRQTGKSLLQATDDSGPPVPVEGENLRIENEALEMSNVNVVEEMVRMVEANRAYEAASKAVTTHDELTGKLIASLGRTG